MTPKRKRLIVDFLRRSEIVYARSPKDFAGTANTLRTYSQEVNQWKYVHMYFAKYVGCWRWVRRWLKSPSDGAVFSVGAGPCLCLLGWFFDTLPEEGQKVKALDILTWSAILEDPTFKALVDHVLSGAKRLYKASVYFPPGDPPPQSHGLELGFLSPLDPDYFPSGATVLLPFVLNHLLGLDSPHPRPDDIFKWLEAVRRRVKRVVIVDMQHDKTKNKSTAEFWNQLAEGLGLRPKGHVFGFRGLVQEFGPCYSDPEYAKRRTGGLSQKMFHASGILGTAKGWSYIF